MKYIYRKDSLDQHYYQVEIPERVRCAQRIGTFSDNKYGGKIRALEAAKRFLEVSLKNAGQQHLIYGHSYDTKPVGMSGVVGVVRMEDKNSNKSPYWRASYFNGEGRRMYRRFSVSKHGECGAFKKACAVRFAHTNELYIESDAYLPCLPDVPFKNA